MHTKRAGTIKYSENLEVAEVKDESGVEVRRCMVRPVSYTHLRAHET